MKNYIPSYFNTKRNIWLLLWVTAIFGEMFILFFQPVQCRTWVDSDWKFLLWVTIVVLTAVSVIAMSRTIMYHYAKRHKISYLDYAIWIVAEVMAIAGVYASFPIVAMRSFAAEWDLTLFYLFKEALFATSFTLLIPYAFVILWMVVKDRGAQIVRLQARQPRVVEEVPEEMYNFYDEKGELKLSAKPNMVYFIEAADNYIMVYYLNAGKLEKLMIRNSLKNIEWRFRDKGLVRCHRSFIVNIRLVKLFRRQEGEVMLDFGDEKIPSIPVSKGYGEGVMSMLL
ncbi:MAG: LytTR family transcriptional regulator [Paludibacteraceae bacterium]|nr:LytTR family transcriptional regulator [Paludibacteraceae bacterium]